MTYRFHLSSLFPFVSTVIAQITRLVGEIPRIESNASSWTSGRPWQEFAPLYQPTIMDNVDM
jgi:hypothetical protein